MATVELDMSDVSITMHIPGGINTQQATELFDAYLDSWGFKMLDETSKYFNKIRFEEYVLASPRSYFAKTYLPKLVYTVIPEMIWHESLNADTNNFYDLEQVYRDYAYVATETVKICSS